MLSPSTGAGTLYNESNCPPVIRQSVQTSYRSVFHHVQIGCLYSAGKYGFVIKKADGCDICHGRKVAQQLSEWNGAPGDPSVH